MPASIRVQSTLSGAAGGGGGGGVNTAWVAATPTVPRRERACEAAGGMAEADSSSSMAVSKRRTAVLRSPLRSLLSVA